MHEVRPGFDLRDNLPTNTYWLSDRIRQLCRSGVNDLTVDLVCITRIVLQSASNLDKVFSQSNGVWLAYMYCKLAI